MSSPLATCKTRNIFKKTKKWITKPLLKGVGGIKLSREAWFSGVVICLSRGLNLSLLLW
jgi:hypothetical protein